MSSRLLAGRYELIEKIEAKAEWQLYIRQSAVF